jgi:hypothetical protein
MHSAEIMPVLPADVSTAIINSCGSREKFFIGMAMN